MFLSLDLHPTYLRQPHYGLSLPTKTLRLHSFLHKGSLSNNLSLIFPPQRSIPQNPFQSSNQLINHIILIFSLSVKAPQLQVSGALCKSSKGFPLWRALYHLSVRAMLNTDQRGQSGGHLAEHMALSPSHPHSAINLLGYNMVFPVPHTSPPCLLRICSADPLLFDVQ